MDLGAWLKLWTRPSESALDIKDVDTPVVWMIAKHRGRIDTPMVFRGLSDLLPAGSCLRLESISIADDVKALLTENPTEAVLRKKPDTIWPRSEVFHVPATECLLARLVNMADRHAEPEICDHLYVYRDDTVLLSWHDFPDPECAMISDLLDEERVIRFCEAIGCECRREANPCIPESE